MPHQIDGSRFLIKPSNVVCKDCRGRERYKRRERCERCGSDREGRGAEAAEAAEVAEVAVGDGSDREEEGHGLPAELLRRLFFSACAGLFVVVMLVS
jgi:hypothetical protein